MVIMDGVGAGRGDAGDAVALARTLASPWGDSLEEASSMSPEVAHGIVWVGGFVLGGVLLAVLAVVVFGSGRLFRDTEPFISFFDGSVSGLAIGAPVRFRGIEVGTVTDASLPGRLQVTGEVSHFSSWNCDRPIDTFNCFSGQVIDPAGNPVAGASVLASGVDYSGTSYDTTDGGGN